MVAVWGVFRAERVDRLGAMWQDESRASSDTAVDCANPDPADDWRSAT